MATALSSNQEISVAVLSGVMDEAEGQRLAAEVMGRVGKGGKLVVDGSRLTRLTPEGVAHLIAVQDWSSTSERRRLRVVGFHPAVWHEIVRQHAEWLFDSHATLGTALESLEVVSAPPIVDAAPPDPMETVAATPVETAPPAPLPARAAAAVPPPPPPMPMPSRTVTANPALPGYSPRREAVGINRWRVPLVAGIALTILTGWGVSWWILSNRPPSVSVSVPSVTAEEDGKEMDDVTVTVQRGKLVEQSWAGLPRGLFFEAASDDLSNKTYLLRGKAEGGAKSSTVQLEATSESGKHSGPVPFTVNVTAKPLTWQLNVLQSLDLRVRNPILGDSKFVTGAAEVSVPAGLPTGLRVELVPGTARDWQLTGMPTAAGTSTVAFHAVSPSGATQEKSCEVQIASDAAATTAASPGQGDAAPGAGPSAAPVTAARPVDDGMRKFLLERIEKLPSRYTDDDRENLRLVVNGLKQSRLVQRVAFEQVGQTELSPDQSAKLGTTLQSADLQTLLKNPDCQIAIVGYASKSGSLAANVRISKARARAVDDLCKNVLGRRADLCGDYGPTDVVDQGTEQSNRVVEIYAGLLDLPVYLRSKAASFRDDFNRRHGAR